MARIVSFVVLVAILLVIAALFFQVMKGFLLPMFLAVLLAVIFGPLHRWFTLKCRGRGRVAAGLTTASIMLIILVPLLAIFFRAASEGYSVYDSLKGAKIDLSVVSRGVVKYAGQLGLQELDPKDVEKAMTTKIQQWLTPLVLRTPQYVGSLLISLAVMVISLYYFLADGPAMIRTIMRLSPLDDRYEEQLIQQFDNTARAVVVATLLSALAQGLLAGVGFYFAGLQSVFLLTVLAMLLAMVPFVGTTVVWIPACLWLHFHDGRTLAAVGLAIYCGLVVSMADNLIKPAILHGRSNLHPLLALLSVLGGVQALGPIGIFVGPMVVAFLQTLLNILQSELDSLGGSPRARIAN
jgi:predicted PurR-regulated permease PerM